MKFITDYTYKGLAKPSNIKDPFFRSYANMFMNMDEENLRNVDGLSSQTIEKINVCVIKRKPALLAALLADILKNNGWSPDSIHFLGSEMINESGMLY